MKYILAIITSVLMSTIVADVFFDERPEIHQLNETVDKLGVRLADLDRELKDKRLISEPMVLLNPKGDFHIMPYLPGIPEPIDIETLERKVIMLADALDYDFFTTRKEVIPEKLIISRRINGALPLPAHLRGKVTDQRDARNLTEEVTPCESK